MKVYKPTSGATCDLFPVAMMSFMLATLLLLEPLMNTWRSAPALFKTNLWLFSSACKRKNGIEDWAKLHAIVHDNFRLPRKIVHTNVFGKKSKTFQGLFKDFFPKIIWRKSWPLKWVDGGGFAYCNTFLHYGTVHRVLQITENELNREHRNHKTIFMITKKIAV